MIKITITETKKPTAVPAVGLINFVNVQNPAAALVSSAFVSSRFRLRFISLYHTSSNREVKFSL